MAKRKKSDIVMEELERAKDTEVIRGLRDLRPAHYLFKIEKFSLLLSNPKIDYFESSDFEVSGYKWKLRLHPKGVDKDNKHISLYLILSESNAFTFHQEVNVYLKLFVYNQIQDKYLTVQDAKGRISRFRGTKTEFGFDQLLPLDVFNDSSNRYLINDCCIFGAELFIVEPISNGECATVVNYLTNNTYTWNVQNFEEVKEHELCESDVFSIGGYKWILRLYPNGHSTEEGKSLSFFLKLEEAPDPGCTLTVDFVLRIKDQLNGKHNKESGGYHFYQFSNSSSSMWGFPDFLPLNKLNDASEGYLVDGSIILEVQVSLITVAKEFS